MGNRTSAASGSDVNGASLRTATYTANALNQYTSVTTSGYKDILGVALATNSVTVKSSSTDRKIEYFHREIPVSNGSGPLWQTATVISGSSSTNGGCVHPGSTQSLTYDLDGNLTFDGVWAYRWDGENRLVEMSMTNVASIPNGQRTDLTFAYDGQGRRVQKIVSTWSGSGFVGQSTNKFLYDGWNLITELNAPNNALIHSYMWGQDLSGTLNKAGGIGGLLMLVEHGSGGTTTHHFAAYDGNWNVVGLIKTDTTLSARYEYSPFGNLIRSTGPQAKVNPFRWSTKFADQESDLIYYGYRYYSPSLGRWLNRDPKPDAIAINLYKFCRNSPFSCLDPDGQSWEDFFQLITATAAGAAAGAGTGYLTSGFNPAGAVVGGMAGMINGFMSGFTGVVYGQSWGTILENAAVTGGLS